MIQSLPGPEDISRHELPNGIVVLSRANHNSPAVVLSGFITTGGLYDTDDKLGLADFTAAALLRGAAGRSFQQIYDLLESNGASLHFGGGTHSTGFNGQALAEDLDLLLTLASDALRQPAFPIEYVERLRGQILSNLAIRSQDTSYMANLAFDRLVYENHPYSRPEDGYPETIQAIRREDLQAFHDLTYGPRGMILVVVGSVEPGLLLEKVVSTFGDWQNPAQPDIPQLPPCQPLSQVLTSQIEIPGKSQMDIVLGVAGPARKNPEFQAANLGNSILGQFGMMGRLGDQVREKAGLAYHISSSLSGGPGPGPWDISAGVDPQDMQRAIDLILDEIRRFTSEPVQDEELEDVKANFIGRLPLSFESNFGVARALVGLERYQLGLDYYRRYADMIRSITAEDILLAAQHYLDPDHLAVAIAGTFKAE